MKNKTVTGNCHPSDAQLNFSSSFETQFTYIVIETWPWMNGTAQNVYRSTMLQFMRAWHRDHWYSSPLSRCAWAINLSGWSTLNLTISCLKISQLRIQQNNDPGNREQNGLRPSRWEILGSCPSMAISINSMFYTRKSWTPHQMHHLISGNYRLHIKTNIPLEFEWETRHLSNNMQCVSLHFSIIATS